MSLFNTAELAELNTTPTTTGEIDVNLISFLSELDKSIIGSGVVDGLANAGLYKIARKTVASHVHSNWNDYKASLVTLGVLQNNKAQASASKLGERAELLMALAHKVLGKPLKGLEGDMSLMASPTLVVEPEPKEAAIPDGTVIAVYCGKSGYPKRRWVQARININGEVVVAYYDFKGDTACGWLLQVPTGEFKATERNGKMVSKEIFNDVALFNVLKTKASQAVFLDTLGQQTEEEIGRYFPFISFELEVS